MALLTFSHAIDLAVPMTNDVGLVSQRLHVIQPAGSTALRDAVQIAIDLRPRDRSRALLLVFTDGQDTSSWLSKAVLDSARRAAIVVHVVRVESDAFLDQLADVTGGRTVADVGSAAARTVHASLGGDAGAVLDHLYPARRAAGHAGDCERGAAHAGQAGRVLVRRPRVHVLSMEKIDYVQAQDDYVSFRCDGKDYLKDQTLAQAEAALDPAKFVRIHRSYLLNLDRLARVETDERENRLAALSDGRKLPVSRSGYARLSARL